MSIEGYIENMKKIQNSLLEFLEEEVDVEENYENLKIIISDQQITEDKHYLKLFLRLINKISNNHRRISNFIEKIERILREIKNEIKNRFSNSEIFSIFEENKRILLFLIKEDLLKIDENIFSKITKLKYIRFKYPQYFAPEIKPFLTEEFIQKYQKKYYSNWIEEVIKEVPEDFEKKRLEGENDNRMCELIRKENTKEFIIYMNKEKISFDDFIKESIFETNQFLLNQDKIKIIEYASFFGCMEIINFITKIEEVKPISSMWEYSIHSENSELIHYLEDNEILPKDNKHEKTLNESIKCHHNDVSRYILNYLIKEEDLENDKENEYYHNLYRYSVEYYNYCFFPNNIKYKYMFHYLCEFDYYTLVTLYLTNMDVDINATNIIISKLNHISLTNFNEILYSKNLMMFYFFFLTKHHCLLLHMIARLKLFHNYYHNQILI